MKHSLVIVCVLAGLFAQWLPAYGQTALPPGNSDPLAAICTNFLDQGGGGVSGDRNRLCSCLSRETKSRLTQDEMKAYKGAADKGQAPPDALMQKVMAIATVCLTEAAGK